MGEFNIFSTIQVICIFQFQFVFRHLKYLIQHVIQLNCNNRSVSLENSQKHTQVDCLRQLNIQYAQHVRQLKHAPVWPTILRPTSLTPTFKIPQYNNNCKNDLLFK